jgi:hypothetical protein
MGHGAEYQSAEDRRGKASQLFATANPSFGVSVNCYRCRSRKKTNSSSGGFREAKFAADRFFNLFAGAAIIAGQFVRGFAWLSRHFEKPLQQAGFHQRCRS